MSLRLAFMGTPDFAAASLAEIVGAGHEVVRVYSQPPRKKGRGMSEQKSPVHALAEQFGLEVHTPASLRDPDVLGDFAALELDVACVVAYGQILPQAALDAPEMGCLNLHGSLLPRWRGAAPIQRAIMAGDAMTGVQIMQMEAGLDTGAILLSEIVPITAQDTAATLHDRMMGIGAQLWPRALAALERGSLEAVAQSEEGVSYAHKITSEEARMDWSRPGGDLVNHVRGLSPFPGAWFMMDSDKGPVRVKLLMAEAVAGEGSPGTVLDDRMTIACGSGALRPVRLQREGKGAMDLETFLRGNNIPKGSQL
ncbi:methionyl-tRNA formyltransferase [Woodsholea maritima]|uniref:methionyl-tRNA formyltransferase n=1 Tax=Woodsholea maritima TaxID=240237 RepID=UPI000368805A|nr:methionyl-tRNA formyltransferase [Woodsholea maritima]